MMDLINKFPEEPEKKLLYVVYNHDMIADARDKIVKTHGWEYFDKYVMIVPIDMPVFNHSLYDVYIDPLVYKYKHSWNN